MSLEYTAAVVSILQWYNDGVYHGLSIEGSTLQHVTYIVSPALDFHLLYCSFDLHLYQIILRDDFVRASYPQVLLLVQYSRTRIQAR